MGEVADLLDIAGAHAFLTVHQADAGHVFAAHQIGNQGMHAGGGEKDRSVPIGNKRGARNHGVAMFLEKFQIFSTQLNR